MLANFVIEPFSFDPGLSLQSTTVPSAERPCDVAPIAEAGCVISELPILVAALFGTGTRCRTSTRKNDCRVGW